MTVNGCRKCVEPVGRCCLSQMGECGDSAMLASLARSIEVPKGSVLQIPKDASAPICFVCQGTVGLQHFLSDGRRTLSELFLPGDVIDCRRDSRQFQGEIVALSDARVLTLSAVKFEKICKDDQRIDDAFAFKSREQAHILRDHCIDIGKKTPAERMASFLFEQIRRQSPDETRIRAIRLQLTYADIGDYLAIQPETVSRTMSSLGSKEMISVGAEGVLEVLDPRKLKKIANGGSPRQRRARSRAR